MPQNQNQMGTMNPMMNQNPQIQQQQDQQMNSMQQNIQPGNMPTPTQGPMVNQPVNQMAQQNQNVPMQQNQPPSMPMAQSPAASMQGPGTPGQAPMTPPAQLQPKEPSPPPPRPRNIFDELLDGYEDVFARLIAKDDTAGCHDKNEVAVGVEYSVNKFISKAQVVELYFNQMIAKQSARSPQDVLTEEIKDLRAEIHRKDQWIDKMHDVATKWTKMTNMDDGPPAKRGKDSK